MEKQNLLTKEEKFQLELLADGGLDEGRRQTLLRRLGETEDGWRECSLAFLEAQCLKESLNGKEFLCQQGIFPADTAPVSSPPPLLLEKEKRPRSSFLKSIGLSVSLSSACGFALAFFLTGFWNEDQKEDLRLPEIQTAFESVSSEEALTPSTNSLAEALSGGESSPSRSKKGSASEPVSSVLLAGADEPETAAEVVPESGGRGVKHIILRRSGDSDGISVPCVAADSYPKEGNGAERFAEGLRKSGCGVETLHEELKFPLKDGKTLIVPVDTINVRRPSDVHFL